jgi:gliding motility-associated-like protein
MKALKIKWKTVFLLCIFYTSLSYAQLADFTLQVTPITESCTANGRLNMVVTNTTPLATIIYTIYKLPNITVPIAVLSANTLTGLISGNYRVVATQSLAELTNSQQQDVIVTDTIVDLMYTLQSTPEVCGNDGKITVTVTNSVAVSYEIFSGPVIRPMQTSNIFNNLPGGNYIIRVFDACGEGLARSYTLLTYNSNVIIEDGDVRVSNCGTIFTLYTSINGNTDPFTIQLTINPPTGLPIVYNYTNSGYISQVIPTFFTQPYTYSIRVTDRCGQTFVRNNMPVIVPVLNPSVSLNINTTGICNDYIGLSLHTFDLATPISVVFLNSPAGFNPLNYISNLGPYNSNYIDYYNASLLFPEGNYTVQVTDACGIVRTASIIISYPAPQPPSVYGNQKVACAIGFGSLIVAGNYASITLLSAPPTFPIAVPHDYTSNLVNGSLYLGVVPEGNYTFSVAGNCGGTSTGDIAVEGYHPGATTVSITENCDSFNLFLNHITNVNFADYFLQKLNPVTNQGGHPLTGNSVNSSNPNNANAIGISNNYNNLNLNYSGSFRILEEHDYYTTNPQNYFLPCPANVIYTFDYTIGPRINNVYSFACQNSLYDAIVIAQGYAPLKYRITMKNGQPFFVNNNFSNIFLGLEPTVYNFQIEDACGNILNSLFDISNPSLFPIQATTFCEGQSGSLTVPAFTFLNYEWRKGNDPTIINTSSTLNFPSFSATTNNGVYHVRVYYTGNPNSCIDFVVDYTININSSMPQAGTGQAVQYCGQQGVIDLFSLLIGNYDSNGSWQDVSSSGLLTNNLLDTTTIISGDFQFKYTVLGTCNTSDQSTVNIEIKALPEIPIASVDEVICNTRELNLQATTIPFGGYLWTGPNGFSSSEQNPVLSNISDLMNGTYTVKGYTNDCDSGLSSVDVVVNPLPEFTLKAGCDSNQYVITAVPTNNSYDPLTASYIWTGPDGFSSIQNPIQITNLPIGLYEVTVINSFGCSTQNSIQISGTHCLIPNVITPNNDDFNQEFNLSGLLIDKLEIYSRWGRLVYQQNNYTNQWHGQNMHDQQLPDSTYYYIVYLRTGEEKQGWVYVTR